MSPRSMPSSRIPNLDDAEIEEDEEVEACSEAAPKPEPVRRLGPGRSGSGDPQTRLIPCRIGGPGRSGPDPGGRLYLRRSQEEQEGQEGEEARTGGSGRCSVQHPAGHGGAQGCGGKKRRRGKGSAPTREEIEAQEEEERQEQERERTTVRVNEFLTVAELGELIDISSTEIIGSAFKNMGLMVTINQRLDFDQIELLLEEFGFTAVRETEYAAEEVGEVEVDAEEDLRPRPAGGDGHGTRRPREDEAPGSDQERQRGRGRGRWNHPAYRSLPRRARRRDSPSPSWTPRGTRPSRP